METRIQVKLQPDAEWVDGILQSGDGPAAVVIDGTAYGPGEVYLVRGADNGPATRGALARADDTGYAVDSIPF